MWAITVNGKYMCHSSGYIYKYKCYGYARNMAMICYPDVLKFIKIVKVD